MKEQTIKKILIVCALEKELRIAKTYYKNHKPEGIQADFLCTGIGNIQMTLGLSQKLSQGSYDMVINYGVCGYRETHKKIIQIVRSVYAPTGKEILSPVCIEFADLESIYCSETPVFNEDILGDEIFVDMESYAVEKVCEHYQIPRIILKVPVDRIGEETRDFNPEIAQKLLTEHIDFQKLFECITEYLSKLPQKNDFSRYMNTHRFTVSETILLEKYIIKYETLSQNSFDAFYQTHKHKDKKLFLAELSQHLLTLSNLG